MMASVFYFLFRRVCTTVSHKDLLSTSAAIVGSRRKQSLFSFRMATSGPSTPKVKDQRFDYFLVLDFEATCDNERKILPQEIIEFPVLKLNWRTLTVDSEFHQYVQPRIHRQLDPFCIELTGIIQEMVDGQPHLEETLDKFHAWVKREVLEPNASFTFVTCGDWDLKTMLPGQCKHFRIAPKPYFGQWINIKKAFAEVTGTYPRSMMSMLQLLNLPHQGRHHSGIDDCKNIANIFKALLERGYVAKNTGFLNFT